MSLCCQDATRTTSWRPSSRRSPGLCGSRSPRTRGRAGCPVRRVSCDEPKGCGAVPPRHPGGERGSTVTATRPKVVVLDYGSGNIRSAHRALERAGAQASISSGFDAAMDCDGLVVPGVGAFAACMAGLRSVRGNMIIDRRLAGGRPVLGICVGIQVLFEAGDEHGVHTEGCGEWPGTVVRLNAPVLPHMGWNTVSPPPGSVLLR